MTDILILNFYVSVYKEMNHIFQTVEDVFT